MQSQAKTLRIDLLKLKCHYATIIKTGKQNQNEMNQEQDGNQGLSSLSGTWDELPVIAATVHVATVRSDGASRLSDWQPRLQQASQTASFVGRPSHANGHKTYKQAFIQTDGITRNTFMQSKCKIDA